MTLSTKPRVVIDTNIFVSGILFGGNPDKVLDGVKADEVILIMSPALAAEIMRLLRYFPVSETDFEDAKYVLSHHSTMILPTRDIKISRDPKDDMLLAISLVGEADYLITGDKDLLILRKFGKTQIVTPRAFLQLFDPS